MQDRSEGKRRYLLPCIQFLPLFLDDVLTASQPSTDSNDGEWDIFQDQMEELES